MMKCAPSHRLFLATGRGLAAANDQSLFPRACVQSIDAELARYFRRAGKAGGDSAAEAGERRFQIGLYGKLGGRAAAGDLRADLLYFSENQGDGRGQREFYAVFQPDILGKEEFFHAFRSELSHIAMEDAFACLGSRHGPQFTFSLGKQNFLVSALHPHREDSELRFRYPTLVFRTEAPALAVAEAG